MSFEFEAHLECAICIAWCCDESKYVGCYLFDITGVSSGVEMTANGVVLVVISDIVKMFPKFSFGLSNVLFAASVALEAVY